MSVSRRLALGFAALALGAVLASAPLTAVHAATSLEVSKPPPKKKAPAKPAHHAAAKPKPKAAAAKPKAKAAAPKPKPKAHAAAKPKAHAAKPKPKAAAKKNQLGAAGVRNGVQVAQALAGPSAARSGAALVVPGLC